MNTVTVTTNHMTAFTNQFDKMVKKAKKLGFPVPVVVDTIEGERNTGETTPFGTPVMEKVWDIVVNYEIPIINGWMVVGNRELVNDVVILNTIDSESDLSSFNKSNKIYCEHCGTNHKRKKSILIKNVDTGTVIEVGTACLKDFVPVTLKSILYFSELESLDDEENKFWSDERVYAFDIKNILTVASALIRQDGYVSKKNAFEANMLSTADCVFMYLDKRGEFSINIDEKDVETATKVIEYFRELDINEYLNNNYMSNIIKLLSSDYVDVKHFGYVCSTIATYHKLMSQDADKKVLKKSEYVGTEGERIKEIEGVLKARTLIQGTYGTTQVLTFKDNDDNIYVSFYSGKNDYEDYVNKNVILSGTVKKHNEYKGIKQTILNRVNIK